MNDPHIYTRAIERSTFGKLVYAAYHGLVLGLTLLVLAGCTGPQGSMGPMGPSGTSGAPGAPGASDNWTTIALEYFDTTANVMTPSTITPYQNNGWVQALATNSIFLSPGQSLGLYSGPNATGGATFAFTPNLTKATCATFAVNRSKVDSGLASVTPVLSIRLVINSQLVGWVDLTNSPGGASDEVSVHYASSTYSQPWYPQPWSMVALSYDPATGYAGVTIDGDPLGVNLPVPTATAGVGRPASSYIDWQFTGQQPQTVVYIDDLTIAQR